MPKQDLALKINIPEQSSQIERLEKVLCRFFGAEKSSHMSGPKQSSVYIGGITKNCDWGRQLKAIELFAKK